MKLKTLVESWFEKWETGDILSLPISENFQHISPYGTIKGKKEYLSLVQANKDKFLGHRFERYDHLFEKDRACVRYKATQGNFSLEVSEWYYPEKDLIGKIIAYYNIDGEISEERKLSNPEEYEKNK